MPKIDRLAPAQRPAGKVVMRPHWHDLLFLHWPFEPQTVQKLLPRGLEVDCFQNQAWVGLVPFTMSRVRPGWLPNLGKWGHFYEQFPEMNVRTYVVRDGVPGVWFWSLDAGSALAVLAARSWFKLPYFKARMSLKKRKDGSFRYDSRRLWPAPLPAKANIQWRVEDESAPAESGSLEHFLVERYVLYSARGDRMFRGRVHHAPYQFQSANLEILRENCLAAAGLARPPMAPHAIYANRVEVEIFGLERC